MHLRKEHVGHPALTDQETGLANLLHFELVYSYLFGACDRGVALTVMVLHVDGLDAGAEDSNALGQGLGRVTRTSDLAAHVGESRFVVLLLGTNLQGGLIAADRILGSIEALARGTISAGLAAYSPDLKEAEELLKAAERALAQAREAGGGVEVVHT